MRNSIWLLTLFCSAQSVSVASAPPRLRHPHKPLAAPDIQEISLELAFTVERTNGRIYFTACSDPITVSDGCGGSLTALAGVRFPSVHGHGQLAFFWHNKEFIGWNSRYEYNRLMVDSARPASIRVRYFGDRRSRDGVNIYRWDGRDLVSNREPPGEPSGPGDIKNLDEE